MRIFGFILIVIGILVLAVPHIQFTKEKKVLDIGPIEAFQEERETIPLSPWLGGGALVAGLVLVIASSVREGKSRL